MTRDYAKKTAARGKSRNPQRSNTKRPSKKSTRNKGAPGWLWLCAGILLGVLVMALVQLAQLPSEEDNSKNVAVDNSSSDDSKPRFDFYTLLRESEVIVPDTPQVNNTSTQPATSSDIFLLQVGSFKSLQDADSLRARLLLLNLDAKIETVSPRQHETWHRVIVGQFSDRSELSSAREKLTSNGIDSLLLKRKK